MFGALRISLAVLVGISHAGFNVFGFNPGVFAVIIFYLISGYVTAALLKTADVQPISFLKERLLRLLPSYFAFAVLAAAIWFFLAPQSHFLSRSPRLADWIANVTVVPLNYFMWSEQDRFTLLPPTWSLGLELQFIMAAPILLRRLGPALGSDKPAPWIIPIFLLSAGFYLVATIPMVIDTDIYGYRLLPGVLWMFLAGFFLQRKHKKLAVAGFTVASLTLISIALGLAPIRPFNVETATGIVFGIPLVAGLAQLRRRWWDDFLANLAYPFFLSHFIVLWLFDAAGIAIGTIPQSFPLLSSWLLLTLALSWAAFYYFERPLISWRRRLRLPRSSAPGRRSPA